MPTPGKNETQKAFISRCIPIVLDEGTAKNNKQAAAICFSIWRKKHGGEKPAKSDIVEDKEILDGIVKKLDMEGKSDSQILDDLLKEQLGKLEELTYGKIPEVFGAEDKDT